LTQRARNWLPKSAFSDDAVIAALSGPVALWSERWIARAHVAISAVRVLDGMARAPAGTQSLRIEGAVVDAELAGRGKRLLLEAMLDIELAGQTLIEGDHHVLDSLAVRALDDLVATLDDTLDAERECDDGVVVALVLSIAGSEMATVRVCDSAIASLLKARLGGAGKPDRAPRERMTALGPLRIVADGVLGHAELALTDLKGLAVGDVLILDQALQEPVALRLSGTGVCIGRGKLGRNDGRISIQL
jgi:flagellar motor switch/type III secretory pathway protein FliN